MNNNIKNWLYNIGAALGILAVIIFSIYLILGWVTKHGEGIAVPKLVGADVQEATTLLSQNGLGIKIIDSVYNENAKPFTIVEQIPTAGNLVKSGRVIYVTINSGNKPKVKMPKLVDMSLTLSKAVIKNNGLVLGKITYTYDEIGNNLVVSQMINGHEIAPGTLLQKGTVIDLVVISNDKSTIQSGDSTSIQEEVNPESLDDIGN